MISARSAVLALLSAWQWTRRFRQPTCRFYPSCSQYTRQAIEKHGMLAGMRLSALRLCKCHPFHDGGVDEVPETLTPALSQIVMKSGLNPPFAGSKCRIFSLLRQHAPLIKRAFTKTDSNFKPVRLLQR